MYRKKFKVLCLMLSIVVMTILVTLPVFAGSATLRAKYFTGTLEVTTSQAKATTQIVADNIIDNNTAVFAFVDLVLTDGTVDSDWGWNCSGYTYALVNKSSPNTVVDVGHSTHRYSAADYESSIRWVSP